MTFKSNKKVTNYFIEFTVRVFYPPSPPLGMGGELVERN